jgi:hypothetical protein
MRALRSDRRRLPLGLAHRPLQKRKGVNPMYEYKCTELTYNLFQSRPPGLDALMSTCRSRRFRDGG